MDEIHDTPPDSGGHPGGDNIGTGIDDTPDALTRLDPRYRRVMMISGAMTSALILAAALIADQALDALPDYLWLGALVIGAVLTFVLPSRRYASRGYRIDADQLRTVQGVWNHWDTIVPFTRVQHLDVHQGVLERGNGIATLVLHTAGTEGSSVQLAGLAYEDAIAMRDAIRDRVQALSR